MFVALDQHPPSITPDDDVFVHLASVYAKTHPTMHKGLPCHNSHNEEKFKDGIVNGATWYTLTGKVNIKVEVDFPICLFDNKNYIFL